MTVVDTNIVAHMVMPGYPAGRVLEAFRKDPEWIAPYLWRPEFRNVLVSAARFAHLSPVDAGKLMMSPEALLAGRLYAVSSGKVINLAADSGCSAYDAEFIVLAQETGVPLLTLDKDIYRKFPRHAILPEDR